MNYQLLVLSALVALFAYSVCLLLVLGVTFVAAKFIGKRIGPEGNLQWLWHSIHVATWLAGSAIAASIIKVAPIGPDLLPCLMLAAILFVVHMRALFVMNRQVSIPVQVVLLLLCPVTALVVFEYF